MTNTSPGDSPSAIARDIASVGRIDAIPTLLRVICETTGMGFSAVARVTEATWTVCAVDDGLDFGLAPGGQLDVDTTLCKEARAARAPVYFDQASLSANYRDHHTPRIYRIESYVSVPIILPDGEYFGNLCAIDPRPARVSDPKVLAMFTRFADLIAVEISNDRANAAQFGELTEARSAALLREQFIAILGHDLRNPLMAINMSARLLASPEMGLSPPALRVATRISSSSTRAFKLVDDILDFARGRMGGGFSVTMKEVHDIGDTLRQVVSEFAQTNPDRQFDVDIDAPRAVLCDRGRLQQLTSNLVANALTHGSPSGPVSVSARVSDDLIALTVSNEGEPIPPEMLAEIFKPFWRRGSAGAGSNEGLGLGLFISAEIVRAHGGQIEAMSSRDSGTTFAVRLPLKPTG